MPSDVETWPVTVSASISRTRCPRVTSAAARLVATVVLPTPPFGLNTRSSWPRWPHSTFSIALWRTGPVPSSTATERMHIASTRQRIDSAE